MDIQSRVDGEFAEVAVAGRLDALSAPALEAALQTAMAGGAARVVLNLAEMEYISSAGLRVLLATAKKLSRQNGRLVLCRLLPSVHDVFRISGLLTIFPIAADEASARTMARE
jgi:anti-anti-sigma factor